MSKLYGRPRSFLTYDETLALSQLRQAFPHGSPSRDLPVPGNPGHFYPAGTKEFLQRKDHRVQIKPTD